MTTNARPMTSPEPRKSNRGPRQSFDDELREFMRTTELSARRIIKKSDKRRNEEILKHKAKTLRDARSKSAHGKSRKVLDDINLNASSSMTSSNGLPDPNSSTQVLAYDPSTPLPKNVLRRGGASGATAFMPQTNTDFPQTPVTVNLQSLPDSSNRRTQVSEFNATRVLQNAKTTASTLRLSSAGRKTESLATSTMYRNSDAFAHSNNYTKNTGIDANRGTNAITRGLGKIRPEGITTDPAQLLTSYHASKTLLDMGHFAKPQNRHANNRGSVTTASRAALLRRQQKERPNTVAHSPARGAPRMAVAKIAMAKMDTVLRDVPTRQPQKSQSSSKGNKFHPSLSSHPFNKSAKSGMISSEASKDYYKVQKDPPTWTTQQPAHAPLHDVALEAAGAVSWSADDIRIKWRGEKEREELWKMARAAKIASKELQNAEAGAAGTQGWIVPTVEVNRHPMHDLYWRMIKHENVEASKRAVLRAKNRRFALDVHTVWLTNLSHLAEHAKILDRSVPPSIPARIRGLTDARDTDNIVKARSQIQSVSKKRFMAGSYFDEENRKWVTEASSLPPPPPGMRERPMSLPTLTGLVENEPVQVPGSSRTTLLSIHRMTTKRREYYETAAVLINGRWEIPKSGGSEKLEPGKSVNVSDDIVKLSPKKYEAKHSLNPSGSSAPFFGDDYPSIPSTRPGEILESMNELDAWAAASGKSFTDLDNPSIWRISLLDNINGEMKSVSVPEQILLERCASHAKKMQLKYDTTKSASPPKIVHRQGARLPCGAKTFAALISVAVYPSPNPTQDKAIYIDITASVKVPKPETDSQLAFFDRSGSGMPDRVVLKKKLNTYECRERLHISAFAPASDLAWWSDSSRSEDVWRPLIQKIITIPHKAEVEPTPSATMTPKPKKEKKKKKKSKEAAAVPVQIIPSELDFPESPEDSIFTVIGSAYSLIPLLTFQDSQPDQDDPPPHPHISLPGAWKSTQSLRVKTVPDEEHTDGGGGTPMGNDPFIDWEFMSVNDPDSQSIDLSGNDQYKTLVPGVCAAGILEPFDFSRYYNFPFEQTWEFDKPRTQAAAVLHRDPQTSSSNAVQVTHILAMETPIYAPISVYWELSETPMPLAQHETVEPFIPFYAAEPKSILNISLDSKYNTRTAPVTYILSGSEMPEDFGGLAELHIDEKYNIEDVVVGHNDLGFEIKERRRHIKPQHKNRRRMTMLDEHGFRQNVVALREIIRPVVAINPAIFGITAKGASLNKTAVQGRTIWHSEQRCVEQLCRQRTPFDYHYVIKAKSGSGFCDPRAYSLLLSGYSLDEMVGVGLSTYSKVYARIDRRLKRQSKMEGLQAKIVQAEETLRKHRTQIEREIRMTSQKSVSVKAKFGNPAGKLPDAMSRDAWLVRYEMSKLIEVRGGWEKREMMAGGAIFYFKNLYGVDGGEIECSWDMPQEYEHWQESEIKPGMLVGDTEEDEGGLRDGMDSSDVKKLQEKRKVEELAKLIAEDESLIKALANKLGILIKRDKGESLDLHVRSGLSADKDMTRGVQEYADSDDAWSDSDDENGNTGVGNTQGGVLAGAEMLPQNSGDVARMRRKERREKESQVFGAAAKPANVPKLALNPEKGVGASISDQFGEDDNMHIEKHVKGKGWRRLERAKVAPSFWEKITNPRPLKSKQTIVNSSNKVRQPLMVDPAKVCLVKDMDFAGMHTFESLFVKDVMGDQLRNIEATRARQEREQQLLAGGGLEMIVANQPSELTLADKMSGASGGGGGADGDDDDPEHLAAKAVEYSRTGNLSELEMILDRNIIDIDSKDNFGNSLLHLCCQQGNKRMVKFLLRRGANINTQNAAGNSVLHHCQVYSHSDLMDYLKSKGADDSLVNAQGCTCYEGLTQEAVEDI